MSVDVLVESVLGQVRTIAEDVVHRLAPRLRSATVTDTGPLRIRYDGEDDASVVTPRTLARVAKGDRVVVAKHRGQATVLGVLGGPHASRWERITGAPGMDYPGHGFYFAIQRDGDRRYMRGRVSRLNGEAFTAGDAWVIGYIAPDDRPTQVTGGMGQVAGYASPGYVRIDILADGEVRAAPSKDTGWIGVDSITWDVM